MIKIRKGNVQKIVTTGAFETYFKPLGYVIIKEKKVEPIVLPKQNDDKNSDKLTKDIDNKNKDK